MVEDHQYFRKVIQHREHFRKLFVRVILFDESQIEKSFRELNCTILWKIVNTYVKESIVEWNCPFERDRSSRGFGLSIHLKSAVDTVVIRQRNDRCESRRIDLVFLEVIDRLRRQRRRPVCR